MLMALKEDIYSFLEKEKIFNHLSFSNLIGTAFSLPHEKRRTQMQEDDNFLRVIDITDCPKVILPLNFCLPPKKYIHFFKFPKHQNRIIKQYLLSSYYM